MSDVNEDDRLSRRLEEGTLRNIHAYGGVDVGMLTAGKSSDLSVRRVRFANRQRFTDKAVLLVNGILICQSDTSYP